MNITGQLLKEASSRIDKVACMEKRSFDEIKSSLFCEADNRLAKIKRHAALQKSAMSYHQGQKEFINSNVTWSKVDLTPSMEAIESQMVKAFKPYFYALIQGRKSEIVPPPLVLRYEATRDLFPVVDENFPETQESYDDAVNAVKVINQIVSGFDQFVQDVENAQFAMLMFFNSSDRDARDGGFDENQLTQFIHSENQRLQKSPLKFNNNVVSKNYYAEHAQAEVIYPTKSQSANRRYDLKDMDRETSKSKIARWIAFANQNGFQTNVAGIRQEIASKEQENLQKHGLLNRNLTPQQQQWKRSIINFYTGRDINNPKAPIAPSSMLGRITKAIKYGCGPLKGKPNKKQRLKHWGQDAESGEYMRGLPNPGEVDEKACPNLDITEFRLLGKHMVGQHPMVPPNTYMIPDETTYYNANGLDSQPNNPDETMLVVPSMKRIPSTGEFVYDKDQGNLMGNHLRKYGRVLESFMKKWGRWAAQAVQTLQSPKAHNFLGTYANQNAQNEDVDSLVPYDAWQIVMNNRTNADFVLEILQKHPSYDSLYNGVINKTLASTITNYNYYSGGGAETESGRASYEPSGFKIMQGSEGLLRDPQNIFQGLEKWVGQLSSYYGQQLQSMPGVDNKAARDELKLNARNDVHEMAYHLTELHDSGSLDWDQYSYALSILGDAVQPNGAPLVRNMKSVSPTDEDQMLSPDGFSLYQQFGYPIAKMLDFLSGVMIRSCNDHSNNKIDKDTGELTDEEHFGGNYSAGSGKAGSTKLMLGVRYAFRASELGSDDAEMLKQMRYFRGKRKMTVPQDGVDVVPDTAYPQKGQEVDPAFQNSVSGKVIENITYWVGQASNTKGFHKGLDEGDGGLLLKSKSWRQTVDYIERKYPQLVSQLGLAFEPINVDLRRLQEATKRSMLAVIEEMGVDAIFEDQEGAKTPISPETVQSDVPIAEEYNRVAEQNNVQTVSAPSDETVLTEIATQEDEVPDVPEPEPEAQVEPEEVPSDVNQESTVSMEDIEAMIEDLDEAAEDNPRVQDELQNIDIAVRQGTLTTDDAYKQLSQIRNKLLGDPEAVAQERDQGLLTYWDSVAAQNQEIPYNVLTNLINMVMSKGLALPPNIKAYIEKQQKQMGTVDQTQTDTYDPDYDDDNYMPMKDMPTEPDVSFIGRRPKGRRLVKNRPDPNTGKLQRADVIDTLIKMADKLDDTGEYVLADKITALLSKVTEDTNV